MSESLFLKRKSKRSFLSREIEQEKLDRIYEHIRWSPSCSNMQPWHFIFVKEKAQREKLFPALANGNEWMHNAPIISVLCAREEDDFTRKDDPVAYYQFDSGLATMSLLLAATEEGLITHPTAGWSAPIIKEALNIPNEYHIICLIPIGYEGSPELLDEKARESDEAPRIRKELSEIITDDKFRFSD